MGGALFSMLVFPGFLFLGVMGFALEFYDRRLYARFQNRQGPPWYQPLADIIKLASKEDIVPENASPLMFTVMPLVALTAAVCSFFYIPLWNAQALYAFPGDLVVVIYLLTIPTLTFFLAGWYSGSLYSGVGAIRALTQLFAYEVPLFLALLAAAHLAGSWSLSDIAAYYNQHPWYAFVNLIGFGVAIIALQGKLERVPFDIPEAETEIVGGAFTEYSGRRLALFRMTIEVELVVGCSLLAAVFLPFGLSYSVTAGFALYLVKVLGLVFILALMRSVMARIRIDQMVHFCWKYVAPAALLQLVISIVVGAFVAL
jgi:NADH-quinone oxidoreductase subunit H